MCYSVLMSVYFKEKPEYLRTSIQSMLDQTIPTNDFVLVCDGILNEGLNEVINELETKNPEVFHVIRFNENHGLGYALNEGIKYCKNELVARMDSDDISRKDRCEKELKIFEQNDDLSIVGSIIGEFSTSQNHIESTRVVPQYHSEIIKFAKNRSPFNHVSVMYKKSAVEDAGGYEPFYLLEDYYLWIRMLLNGVKGYNIQESLVWVRVGNGMYGRRGGFDYIKSQNQLFRFMKDKHYINGIEYICSVVKRCIFSILPTRFRKLLYKEFLRR